MKQRDNGEGEDGIFNHGEVIGLYQGEKGRRGVSSPPLCDVPRHQRRPDALARRMRFPEDSRGWRCCGSWHGWLDVAGLDAGFRLFNPVSGSARLELPSLTTLPLVAQVVTGPEMELAPLQPLSPPVRSTLGREAAPCGWTA